MDENLHTARINIDHTNANTGAVASLRAQYRPAKRSSDDEERIARVLKRWSGFISDASVEQAMKAELKASDVVVATHSKAG